MKQISSTDRLNPQHKADGRDLIKCWLAQSAP